MRSQWKAVIGSSICLASVPTLALAANHAPEKRSPQHSRDSTGPNSASNRIHVPRRLSGTTSGSTAAKGQDMSSQMLRVHPAVYKIVASYAQPRLRYITVHAGDSLWSLAHRYHVSLRHLERWNHLRVDSLLPIGIRLTLNGPNPSPPKVHKMERTNTTRSTALKSRVASTKTALSSRGEGAAGPLAAGVLGLAVIDYAKQFIGTPYVWGGESTRGFDCSGFVQFVYTHFGVSLGRTTYQQFDEGRPVYRADLLPGDLVFFNTYGSGPSHVGMYVGGGMFIASSGSGVQVMSLSKPYWEVHYIGARRV